MIRKLTVFITTISLILAMGCNNASAITQEANKSEETVVENPVQEEPEEPATPEEPEITPENYDYTTDPNTLVVNITEENIDEYFDLIVIKCETGQDAGKYAVKTHSIMYDKGYVVVGTKYTDCDFCNGAYQMNGILYDFHEISPDEKNGGSDSPFNFSVCWLLDTEEIANEYAAKGIKYYKPTFSWKDATIYYQKIEDVKFGYSMEDGKRIVNGKEVRDMGLTLKNPF